MQNFLGDLRFSLRELRKRRGLAITAVLSLALGIGATTAVFSVVYGLMVNPFPYKGADRMIHLVVIAKDGSDWWPSLTGPQIDQLRKASCIESVVVQDEWDLTTTDEDLPENAQAIYFTGNAGSHFGVPALLGRTLIPSDTPAGEDPQPVVVLGYLFWQRHFAADPSVVGRSIQLLHKNYSVVGVMPARFTWGDGDVYLPLKVGGKPNAAYEAMVKLKPSVSHAAADAELQALFLQFAKQTPSHFPKEFHARVKGLNDRYVQKLGHSLFLLLGAVALLLLIGCGNVSILLLARGTARQHELTVRAAIGASRWQIQRQLLTESLTLSLLGAAGGVLLAYRLLALIVGWLPEYSFPHEIVIGINLPVLLFSVALGILTGTLAGLSPALQFSRPEVAQLLQAASKRTTGGVRGKRTHNVLVTGQIALTLVLLTAAAATVNGFVRLIHTSLGYDPHNVMSVGIPVHENAHIAWEDRKNYFERIRSRVAAMPEVVAAGISTNATPPSNGWDTSLEILGRPAAQQQQARLNFVSTEYFPVLHIPLLQGRLWDQSELLRGARLAVVNRKMASQYWPNGDVIGRELRFPDLKSEPPYVQTAPGSDTWLQIIGVVADARDDGLVKPVKPAVFVPFSFTMREWTQILVRTRGEPTAVLNRVRAEVKAVDPDQQVQSQVRNLEQWIQGEQEYSYGRLVAALFTGFSLLGLLLAAVGLYSVVSYGVAQRTNEFGIRVALGAQRQQVLRLVFASTAGNVIAGVVCGAALSLALSKFLSQWAEGSAYDPLLFAGVVVLLLLTATLAAFVPARRASGIDPMEALRYE